MQTLEASALDDALDILNNLFNEIFGKAFNAGQKARLRSIRDLDSAAMTVVAGCFKTLPVDSFCPYMVQSKYDRMFPITANRRIRGLVRWEKRTVSLSD